MVKYIYIGQSKDIFSRWSNYKTSGCKSQPKLMASFLYYGTKNHIFEVIEECERDQLNYRESFWQTFYEVKGDMGLNCVIVLGCKNSKTTRAEEIINIETGIFHYSVKEASETYGIKNKNLSNFLNGRVKNKTSLIKCEDYENNLNPYNLRYKHRKLKGILEIVNYNTGDIVNSIEEAAILANVSQTSMRYYLDGSRPNRSEFIYKKEYDAGNIPENIGKYINPNEVSIVNILNGDIYKTYSEASRVTGISLNVISRYFIKGQKKDLPFIKLEEYDPNFEYNFDINLLNLKYKDKLLNNIEYKNGNTKNNS